MSIVRALVTHPEPATERGARPRAMFMAALDEDLHGWGPYPDRPVSEPRRPRPAASRT